MEITQATLSRADNSVAPAVTCLAGIPIDEKSQALEALIRQAGHRGLDHVRALAADGWIVLRGRVPSYYLKQLAQESVRPMAIGMQIRNELHVCK